MNYETVTIPGSPTQRQYHYGLRRVMGCNVEPITWFSDYGRHVHSTVQIVFDYDCIIEMGAAMRNQVAERIRFLRKVTRLSKVNKGVN